MAYLNGQILIVDGDEDISALMKSFLESEGYRATSISSSAGMIDSIPTSDIVLYIINEKLTDRHIARMCEQIRERDAETPILICSTDDQESKIDEAMRAGASGYIYHPQDWIKLINKIRFLTYCYLTDDRKIRAVAEAVG